MVTTITTTSANIRAAEFMRSSGSGDARCTHPILRLLKLFTLALPPRCQAILPILQAASAAPDALPGNLPPECKIRFDLGALHSTAA